MTFGLIMLALTGIGTYFYIYHLKPAQEPDSGLNCFPDSDKSSAQLKQYLPPYHDDSHSLTDCAPGTIVRIRDVGLSMENIDGSVLKHRRYKSGSFRWTNTVIDQGHNLTGIHSSYRDDTVYFVELREISPGSIGLQWEDFRKTDHSEPESLTYDGQQWTLNGRLAASYCYDDNYLEQIPCLIWFYEDQDKSHRIQVNTLADKSVTLNLQAKISSFQMNIIPL
ncbi:MAG: hypothetical protein H6618_06025 [Deltaproteobacteria bacterium]|nr:hypothetical protein [Deltaproteobacteria bacterium]